MSEEPARFVRSTSAAWRRLGDETVVLDLSGKRILSLNATASVIWDLLGDPIRPEDAALLAGAELDGVNAFLNELERMGLVVATAERSGERDSNGTPPPPAEPPRVLWNEPMASAVGQCVKQLGNPGCGGGPYSNSP